jgi:hypothetical protein
MCRKYFAPQWKTDCLEYFLQNCWILTLCSIFEFFRISYKLWATNSSTYSFLSGSDLLDVFCPHLQLIFIFLYFICLVFSPFATNLHIPLLFLHDTLLWLSVQWLTTSAWFPHIIWILKISNMCSFYISTRVLIFSASKNYVFVVCACV